jgi:hypothetical protein
MVDLNFVWYVFCCNFQLKLNWPGPISLFYLREIVFDDSAYSSNHEEETTTNPNSSTTYYYQRDFLNHANQRQRQNNVRRPRPRAGGGPRAGERTLLAGNLSINQVHSSYSLQSTQSSTLSSQPTINHQPVLFGRPCWLLLTTSTSPKEYNLGSATSHHTN